MRKKLTVVMFEKQLCDSHLYEKLFEENGFRPSRSCLSALLDVFDNIMHMLVSKSSVDMVYLEFQRLLIRWIMASFCINLEQLG